MEADNFKHAGRMKESPDDLLKTILSQPSIKKLIAEVEDVYGGKSIETQLGMNDKSHGAFDWTLDHAKILINPDTGLNEANLAHELVHALQYKQGFPFLDQTGYQDKRHKVLRGLNSNILHIHLAEELEKRGFSVKDYFDPTVSEMVRVLSRRKSKETKELPILRIHYDAVEILRMYYERSYLTQNQQGQLSALQARKSPVAKKLSLELKEIIDSHDVTTPEGSAYALRDCLINLNGENASSRRSDYESGMYDKSIEEIEEKFIA